MRVLLAVAALAASLGNCALAQQDQEIQKPLTYLDYYRMASAKLSAGRDGAALSDLKQVLDLSPTFAPAQYFLAATYLKLGFGKKAEEYSVPSICSDDRCIGVLNEAQDYEATMEEARRTASSRDYDTTVQLLNHALEHAPKSVEALRMRSEGQFSRGNAIEAVADLRLVVQLQPQDAATAARLAVAQYVWLDERDTAWKLLRRASQYDSEAAEPRYATKQLRQLEKQLSGSPLKVKYAKVHEMVMELQKWAGAATAVSDDADDGDLLDRLRHERCDAWAHKGAWDRAARVCANVRDSDPEFAPAQLVQAFLDRKAGNSMAALQTVVKLIQGGQLDEKLAKYAQDMHAEIQAERQQQYFQQQQSYGRAHGGSSGGGPSQATPEKDYYETLAVNSDADTKTIRKAYRELSKKYHPDKYRGNDMTEDQVMAKMQEINEAYETLSNEDSRREYDSLRSGGGGGSGQDFAGRGSGGQGFPGGGGFQNIKVDTKQFGNMFQMFHGFS